MTWVRAQKKIPTKPEGVNEDLWALMVDCWAYEPQDRPKFPEIVKRLGAIEMTL